MKSTLIINAQKDTISANLKYSRFIEAKNRKNDRGIKDIPRKGMEAINELPIIIALNLIFKFAIDGNV